MNLELLTKCKIMYSQLFTYTCTSISQHHHKHKLFTSCFKIIMKCSSFCLSAQLSSKNIWHIIAISWVILIYQSFTEVLKGKITNFSQETEIFVERNSNERFGFQDFLIETLALVESSNLNSVFSKMLRRTKHVNTLPQGGKRE